MPLRPLPGTGTPHPPYLPAGPQDPAPPPRPRPTFGPERPPRSSPDPGDSCTAAAWRSSRSSVAPPRGSARRTVRPQAPPEPMVAMAQLVSGWVVSAPQPRPGKGSRRKWAGRAALASAQPRAPLAPPLALGPTPCGGAQCACAAARRGGGGEGRGGRLRGAPPVGQCLCAAERYGLR